MTTTYNFPCTFMQDGLVHDPSVAPTVTVVDMLNDAVLVAPLTPALARTSLVGAYFFQYVGADNLVPLAIFHTDALDVDKQDISVSTPTQVFYENNLLGGTGDTPYIPHRAVDGDGNPLAGIETRVTSDDLGETIVASAITDATGFVRSLFMLYAGHTYYIWRFNNNYSFTNPEVIVV